MAIFDEWIVPAFDKYYQQKRATSAPNFWGFEVSYPGQKEVPHPHKYKEMTENYLSWAYAAARPIIKEIASVRWQLNRISRTDPVLEKEQIHKHPALTLLNRPNDKMTKFQMMHFLEASLLFTGNAYLIVQNNGFGRPAYLWPALSYNMKIVPDEDTFIKGYLYKHNNKEQAFLHPSDPRSKEPNALYCIHVMTLGPKDPYYGVGAIEAAAYEVDTQHYMNDYNINLFRNGAFVGGAVETDKNLSETQERDLRMRFEAAYRGVKKAGKVMMLSHGFSYKQIVLSPEELTLLQLMNFTKEQIFMMFGTPQNLAGNRTETSKSGGDWANYDFYKSVVNPDLMMFKDAFQYGVIERFEAKSILELDYDPVIPRDEQMEHNRRVELAEKAIIEPNEARAEINKPPRDWGEYPLVNNQMVPINEVFNNPNNPVTLAREQMDMQRQQAEADRELAQQVQQNQQNNTANNSNNSQGGEGG